MDPWAVRNHTPLPLADHAAIAAARGILLDWDGCIAVGDRILPATRRLIARHGDRVAIVSNNSTHLPEQFARVLAREGLSVPTERIFLAGAEAVGWVARMPAATPNRVMVIGVPQMRALALRLQVNVVRDAPDTVLLLRDPRLGYAMLARAANALHRGARLVVANGDVTHPGAGGCIVPETGALLAALCACVPTVQPLLIGKPQPLLFDSACAALGIAVHDAVMIGDNPATDIAGARALGMRCIHVLPQMLEDPAALVA